MKKLKLCCWGTVVISAAYAVGALCDWDVIGGTVSDVCSSDDCITISWNPAWQVCDDHHPEMNSMCTTTTNVLVNQTIYTNGTCLGGHCWPGALSSQLTLTNHQPELVGCGG